MDAIALTLTVCLLAAPDRCETREAALFGVVTQNLREKPGPSGPSS